MSASHRRTPRRCALGASPRTAPCCRPAFAEAVPFFERAGNAASGRQAKFCHCLAHLAHALQHFDAGDVPAGRTALGAGLALAQELAWLNFFRACPPVAAAVCAQALEHGIEAPFVREVIAERAPVGRYSPGRGRSARKARRWI